MSDRRYGFYLRPSFAMCRAQIEIHALLERQYGLRAAGRFMPHATIKGFFRSDGSVAEMVSRLDVSLAGFRPFTVFNHGVAPYGNLAIVLDIHGLSGQQRNPALFALHRAALDALLPLVHADCEFAPGEWTDEFFRAHLTLAMSDIPAPFFDEVLAFVTDAEPIGPPEFLADVVQLFSFESDEWSGRWWETLRWQLLHSWHLPPNGATAEIG